MNAMIELIYMWFTHQLQFLKRISIWEMLKSVNCYQTS